MKYWIEKTLVKGRQDRLEGDRALGRALWSPRKDRRGADIYKNMREVGIGDVVIHLVDNKKIAGVSIAESSAIEASGLVGTEWDGPAYLIRLGSFESLNPEIQRDQILNQENIFILDEIKNESEVFYNSNLNLRHGAYLTPCPIKLVSCINNAYRRLSNNDLPHINSSDFSNIDTNNMIFNNKNFKQVLINFCLCKKDKLDKCLPEHYLNYLEKLSMEFLLDFLFRSQLLPINLENYLNNLLFLIQQS